MKLICVTRKTKTRQGEATTEKYKTRHVPRRASC